jgi:hypothetical protein
MELSYAQLMRRILVCFVVLFQLVRVTNFCSNYIVKLFHLSSSNTHSLPTYFSGQISSLTTSQPKEKSSMSLELSRFVRFIAILALSMGAIIFVISMIVSNGTNVLNTFITGFLVIIVSNLPQGLPGLFCFAFCKFYFCSSHVFCYRHSDNTIEYHSKAYGKA